MPLYIAFSPPQMLPTTTLNPTATATGGASATSASSQKSKRGLEPEVPALMLNWNPSKETADIVHRINPERLWWVGLAFTGIGGLLYFGPRRLGITL